MNKVARAFSAIKQANLFGKKALKPEGSLMFGMFYAPLSNWKEKRLTALSQKACCSPASFDAWFDAIEALRKEPDPPFSEQRAGQGRTESYVVTKWEERLEKAAQQKATDFEVYSILCQALRDFQMPLESFAIFAGPWPDYYARAAKIDERKANALAVDIFHYNLMQCEAGRALCAQALPHAVRGVENLPDEEVFSRANALTYFAEQADVSDYFPAMGSVLVKRAETLNGDVDQFLMGYRVVARVADGLDPKSPLVAQMQKAGADLLDRAASKDLDAAVICAVQWMDDPLLSFRKRTADALLEQTTRFVIQSLPRYAKSDSLAALKVSGAALNWSEKLDPAVRELALAACQERMDSYVKIDSKEIGELLVSVATQPDATRTTIAYAWHEWERVAREIYAKDPIEGIGFAAYGLVIVDRNMRIARMRSVAPDYEEWERKTAGKRSEIQQIIAQTAHMKRVCASLCGAYKIRHPFSSFNRCTESYIFQDGESPYTPYPSLKKIGGFRAPALAVSCLRDFVRAHPERTDNHTATRQEGPLWFLH